jgi:hypothetical protein
VAIELAAEIYAVAGQAEIKDGWRGLLDFGEKWTEDDSRPWQPEWGEVPLGHDLIYGCSVQRDPAAANSVVIQLWALDEPREVMRQEATFVLRDGPTARATGTLL